MKKPTKKEVIRDVEIMGVIIVLLIMGFLLYGFTNMSSINEKVNEEIYMYGGYALLLISLFLDLFPQILSPAIILATGILAGINPTMAIISVAVGSLIGSSIGFFLGRRYMFGIVNLFAKKKSADKMTNLINKYGKIIVPIAAISPLPYVPVVFGAMNFSWKNFIIYGLIPRALSFAVYGYFIQLI